jgi:ABC-2 type transport system ATP-binding protein
VVQARLCGMRKAAAVNRAAELAELYQLDGLMDTPLTRLSGGQRRRFEIAAGVVHRPAVLFLDEPTAALDPQARRNLWDVLRAINTDGRTIVLTTHYMDEAEILCDRVAIMDRGRILRSGPPAALVRDLDASARVSVASGVIGEQEARTLPGADEVTDDGVSLTIATRDAATVVKALADRGALEGVQIKGATLEDVFLDLTGREYRA